MNFTPFSYFSPTLASNPPVVSFIGITYSAASSTSYTFTNLNLGGSGLCVVSIHGEVVGSAGRRVTGVTIGGTSATEAVKIESVLNASGTNGAIYYLRQGATNSTVVVNFGQAPARCLVGIYRITNNSSDTPYRTATASVAGGNSPAGLGITFSFTNLDADSVGVCNETIGLDTVTGVSWTNATLDYNVGSGAFGATRGTGASFITTSSGDRLITATHSNSTQPLTLVGAVWK